MRIRYTYSYMFTSDSKTNDYHMFNSEIDGGAYQSLKRVHDQDVDDENRQRAGSSDPQRRLKNVSEGVAFFSLMNPKKRFFLPSSKNIFGGFKVARVLCDSGCSSLLLPIESPEILGDIFERLQKDCKFSIKGSENVGGSSTCLVVEYTAPQRRFDVNLCSDIMGLSGIFTERLRFSLCRDDIEAIRQSDSYRDLLTSASLERLETATGPQKRRTHALLGQDILLGFCLIKYEHVELYVDPSHYMLPRDFRELRDQTSSLEMQLRQELPDKFDDWEDDDFAYEDDDVLSSGDFE